MKLEQRPLLASPCAALAAVAFFALSVCASSTTPALSGLPKERTALGDAFVDAWLSFRRDIDAAPHAGAHPALLDAWFAAAPRFIARDTVRIATHAITAEVAARRLADGVRQGDLALLASLERRFCSTPLATEFRALRLVAGDPEAKSATFALLASPEPFVALEGARALAAANDARGLDFLRRSLERRDGTAGASARALGLYGTEEDVARLEAARSRGVDEVAVDVGLGHLAMRRFFPLANAMFSRRDPEGMRFDTVGGLYDTWLATIGRAARAGAHDEKSLFAHIERERAAAQGFEGEPVRRSLQSLIDFWADIDLAISATPPSVDWPSDFEEANRVIITAAPKDIPPPVRFSRRFAAAITVLAAAGSALDYERLAPVTEGIRFVSARGDRASDGSFATSWRGGKGAELVFDIAPGKAVRRLWLAAGCAESQQISISVLRVDGTSAQGDFSVSQSLVGKSRYFEEIPLGAPRSGRISISIEAPRDRIACISELRAE